jgi:hypothetical protein
MPDRHHRSNFPTPPNSPDRLPYHVPGNYTPASQPPTRPGWYFCQLADRHLCYLYWPGDWGGVLYWVELPEFVQELLGPG